MEGKGQFSTTSQGLFIEKTFESKLKGDERVRGCGGKNVPSKGNSQS